MTHWGKPFSAEGMCSDEFVNSQGGTGVSLELGQNGFDIGQIAAGVQTGLWALRAATGACDGRGPGGTLQASDSEAGPLFTWAGIVPWPERGYVELAEWSNFDAVNVGQELGRVDGRPLLAPVAGKVLFPKYLTRAQQEALEIRPTELCRIMRRISPEDLPPGA